MKPTDLLRMRASAARFGPIKKYIYNRPNRVPYYQALFQSKDGARQWWQTPRSKYMLYPFFAFLWFNVAMTGYALIRITLGYKDYFGTEWEKSMRRQ